MKNIYLHITAAATCTLLLLGHPVLAETPAAKGIYAPQQIKIAADTSETEEYVKNILRPNYERISAVKKWERVETKEVSDPAICLGDAKLAYYHSDKGLEKIVAKLVGETHETTTEYYFLDNRLSFIHSKRKEFDGDKYEWRGYFKDDTCFRVLGNQGKKLSPDEMKEWLLDETGYRQYATYLAILKHGALAAAEPPAPETAATPTLDPAELHDFLTPDPSNEEHPFRADPQGRHYHFGGFAAALGDSPWDTFWNYEEHFAATSHEAANLRNAATWVNGVIRARDGGGDRTTAWSAKGNGIGEKITMRLRTKARMEEKGDQIRFDSILIVNGNAKDETTWKNSTRVKTLRLYIGGKHWCDLKLKDTIKPQVFTLLEAKQIYPAKVGKRIAAEGAFARSADEDAPNTPVYQTELVFEILETYPGADTQDTAITGIALDVQGGMY